MSGLLHRGELHISQPVVRLTAIHKAASLAHGGVVTHGQGEGLVHALGVSSPAAVSHLSNTADGIGIIEIFLQPCPVVVRIRPCPASAHGELGIHLLLGLAGQTCIVTEDQRLALPHKEELAVLLPVLIRVHGGEQLLHI